MLRPNSDLMRHSMLLWILTALILMSQAHAYPTSIIFVPTGDVKKQGDLNVFVYTSVNYDPVTSAGGTWFGGNIGILPEFKYGNSGTGFGGLEAGFDVVDPSTYIAAAPEVKPVFNVKAQLLTESETIPHVSIGAMDLDPFKSERGSNVVYAVATKTLGNATHPYGRVTIGFGNSFTNNTAIFYGTAPFRGHNEFLLGGYESPSFGPLSFQLEYFGGVSELSSTNIGVSYTPLPGAVWSVGGYFDNDRSNPATTYDGIFTVVALNWNVKPNKPAD